MTFKGPRKARGKRSEAPPTSVAPDAYAPSSSTLPDPSAPSTSTPHLPQFLVQLPASTPASDFLFTLEMLHSMMQGLSLHSIMPMEDFHA